MSKFLTTRTINDLIDSLKRHLRLLEQYHHEAFENNNEDYFGEIAGKIRLLAIGFGSNKPLLINLMKEFEIEPKQIFDGPPIIYRDEKKHLKPGESYTLETLLTLDCMGAKTQTDGFKTLNKSEFILLLAEKHGAAHEDWNHPEILKIIISDNIYFGDKKIYLHELSNIARWVIWAGNNFISQLNEDLIEEVSNKRKLAVNYSDYIAHGKLGTYYLNKRELKKSHRHLLKSYELNKDVVETHWNLACLFSLQRDYDNSIFHLKIIMEKWGPKELGDPYKDQDLEKFVKCSRV